MVTLLELQAISKRNDIVPHLYHHELSTAPPFFPYGRLNRLRFPVTLRYNPLCADYLPTAGEPLPKCPSLNS